FDFSLNHTTSIVPTGAIPIATGMMPDASKYYVANFLDSTITVIETNTGNQLGVINLLEQYNPVTGAYTGSVGGTTPGRPFAGPVGGLPIQTPVSPDGRYM